MDMDKLLELARESIVTANEEQALSAIESAAHMHMDLLELLRAGFGAGNWELAELFESGRLSLPELLYCTEVMNQATSKINAMAGQANENKQGRILIATVEGDAHDIGKGILVATLQAYGFDVIDLGRDVPVWHIIEQAERHDVSIIGTSALLTTTLPEQKKLEETLRKQNLRHKYKTMVGGAPCTARWAKKIGADAYAEDAVIAVKRALALIKK